MAAVWLRRLVLGTQIAVAACALIATFSLGFWLTAPKFPVSRKFIAVSLNGEPIISAEPGMAFPSFELRREPSGHAFDATITFHCGGQYRTRVSLIPPNLILWEKERPYGLSAAAPCTAWRLEQKYFAALLGARRWRTDKGTLILDNGTDVLRFMLHPS